MQQSRIPDTYLAIIMMQVSNSFPAALLPSPFSASLLPLSFVSLCPNLLTSFSFFDKRTQFCLIMLDRVIYLFRSLVAKTLLQFILIGFYHITLFFYLPSFNQKSFHDSPSLAVFYVFKCLYLLFSAHQVSIVLLLFFSPLPLSPLSSFPLLSRCSHAETCIYY